ncbi:hypothetical protein Rs2_47710 [Raphanus sativus]|nr:hypothetical protein Rs2_47710 [Raphanus sativus]
MGLDAVQEELESQLLKEKPRNHLDLRNRLNSKGQREGKVIDYRMSDLRVVDLLTGCVIECRTILYKRCFLNFWSRKIVEEGIVAVKSLSLVILVDKQEAKAHANDISNLLAEDCWRKRKMSLLR